MLWHLFSYLCFGIGFTFISLFCLYVLLTLYICFHSSLSFMIAEIRLNFIRGYSWTNLKYHRIPRIILKDMYEHWKLYGTGYPEDSVTTFSWKTDNDTASFKHPNHLFTFGTLSYRKAKHGGKGI